MAKFDKTIVTNQGLAAIQKAYAENGHFKFYKATSTSDDLANLSVIDIKKITKFETEPQTKLVDNSYAADGKVVVNVTFDNKDLKEDYYLTGIALYIKNDKEELILYSITLPSEKSILITAGDGHSSSGLDITFNTAIDDDGTAQIGITDVGMATHTDLKRLADDIDKKTDEKLSKLTGGGRNFILNGDFMQGDTDWLTEGENKPENTCEIVDIDTLPGFSRAVDIINKVDGENNYEQIGISVIPSSKNVFSVYVRAKAGTVFWLGVFSAPRVSYTAQDDNWHRYSLVYYAEANAKTVGAYVGIGSSGEIWATGFQHEVGTHMSDFHAADIDRQDTGGRNYWDMDKTEVGFYDKDGSINTSKPGAQYDQHMPLQEIPALYGYLTLSTFDGYDYCDHTTLAFFDKDKNIIGEANGTDNPLGFEGEPSKMSITVPIPVKAEYFGVSFWKATGARIMVEFGNVAHDYIISTEHLQNQVDGKQDRITKDGDWKLVSCPDGTDLGEFLQSDAVPVGFCVVRDDNKGKSFNFLVTKENKNYIYCVAYGYYNNIVTYGVIKGVSVGYNNVTLDENNHSGVQQADGEFHIMLFKKDNKTLDEVIKERLSAKIGSFTFYAEKGVPTSPSPDQSIRGIVIAATDGIGIIYAIDNSQKAYIGHMFNSASEKKVNWHEIHTDNSVRYVTDMGIKDLNDLKRTGTYAIGSATVANTPIKGMTWAFVETSLAGGTGGMCMQKIYYDGHSDNAQTGIYIRHYSGSPSSWSKWHFVGYPAI